MITVKQATDIIFEHAGHFDEETVPLDAAWGRVLRESLNADRDFPPFPRVTMDGIAIAFQSFAAGQRQFFIEGIQAAGAPQIQLSNPAHALEVMTGAMLPSGADTVIRYEDLLLANGTATVQTDDISSGQNVHPRGYDRRAGDEIIPAGRLISGAEAGVAATIGKTMLRVAKLPRVAVVTTGDELVEVGADPLPHQIRVSNAYSIQALLRPRGVLADRLHISDDLDATIRALGHVLQDYDALLLSGGVSEGKFDYVPRALAALGVRQLFHKVAQRPGKPFWFGQAPGGAAVFALPGNPVSAFVGTMRYFLPWLRHSLGLPALPAEWALLAEPFEFKPNLTYFLQVRLQCSETGQNIAYPIAGKGSGDLANLANADGFLELPQERDRFEAGEVFRVWRYR